MICSTTTHWTPASAHPAGGGSRRSSGGSGCATRRTTAAGFSDSGPVRPGGRWPAQLDELHRATRSTRTRPRIAMRPRSVVGLELAGRRDVGVHGGDAPLVLGPVHGRTLASLGMGRLRSSVMPAGEPITRERGGRRGRRSDRRARAGAASSASWPGGPASGAGCGRAPARPRRGERPC
jgi:hypothetical protein